MIQRPASVIKELVENSVDAGATRINVLLVNAGKTSIQVIDNGVGMSVTDARLAFERHATSKIRKAEDLFSLHTMGFRGEALPSIASVAQVTLKTRQADETLGVSLRIEGGKVMAQDHEACPQGSNFLVENLFFNVPVRRRFLKTNATELTNIITAFQRIVLVYPHIAFTLHHNGQELLNLRPGNAHQRIVEIFGKKINQTLLPVDVNTSLGNITGFVAKPEASHKKNLHQFFFVNGRYMKHPSFHKAVISAYERLIPEGEQVSYFIYFDINPQDIDVNIHPTKTEIKFVDESSVWQILNAAVREAIGKHNSIPTIDFDTEGRPEMPVYAEVGGYHVPTIDFNPEYNPFKDDNGGKHSGSSHTALPDSSRSGIGESSRTDSSDVASGFSAESMPFDYNKRQHAPDGWQSLYDGINAPSLELPDVAEASQQATLFDGGQLVSGAEDDGAASQFDDRSKHHLQYKGAYILTPVAEGLMVTDQERAHQRVLYEQYMANMDKVRRPSQRVMFPETVQFSLAERISLPEILPDMEALGFDLSDLGGGTYAINGVPAGLESVNSVRLVTEMVSMAIDAIGNGTPSDIHRMIFSSLAVSMASNAAIPHGQVLSNDEMEKLIADLLACDNSRYTPKGQQIYNIIPHQQVALPR